MLTAICLLWVGAQLNAPDWYNWCLYIAIFIKTCGFIGGVYKLGKEAQK